MEVEEDPADELTDEVPDGEFYCAGCGIEFATKDEFMQHTGRLFVCECEERFKTKNLYTKHIKTCYKTIPAYVLGCHHCDLEFDTEHDRNTHIDALITCDCGRIYLEGTKQHKNHVRYCQRKRKVMVSPN